MDEDRNQKISQLENKEVIEDKLTEWIAGAFTIPAEAITNFNRQSSLMQVKIRSASAIVQLRQQTSEQRPQLSQDDWYSTQTTVYSLIVISKYSGATNAAQKILQAQITMARAIILLRKAPCRKQVWLGKSNVSLINRGNNVLYAQVINLEKPLSNHCSCQ